MMDQDGMISSSDKTQGKCDFIHDDDDGGNWYKQDMVAWLARYEQLEQENQNVEPKLGNDVDGVMNVELTHQKGVGITKVEPYEGVALNPYNEALQNMTLSDLNKSRKTIMVNPNSLMPTTDEQQQQSNPDTYVLQRNAVGMNIPWLKATVSKSVSNNLHGNTPSNHWTIKNISQIQNVPECRKLGTKCCCPDANTKIVFRNKSKLQYVWDYNVHNEPSDAVKEVLVDQYMVRITCIINSYEPKTAELLKHKAVLLGHNKQKNSSSWLLGGGQKNQISSSVPAKNVTYCTYRGKRGTTHHQVPKLWSPQPFPPMPQGTRKKGGIFKS